MAGGDAVEVELEKESFSVDVWESEIGDVRDSGASTIDGGVGRELGFKMIAERMGWGSKDFEGFGKAQDAGEIFRSGTVVVFLTAAGEECGEFLAATEKDGADAFGAVEFMGGDGKPGDAGVHFEGVFAYEGDQVKEEGDVVFLGDGGDRVDVDFYAGFTIGSGEEDGAGFWGDCLLNVGWEGGAVGGNGDVDGIFDGFVNGGVFDVRGDDGAVVEASDEEVEPFGAA